MHIKMYINFNIYKNLNIYMKINISQIALFLKFKIIASIFSSIL